MNFKPNVGGKVSKKEAMEWIEKYDKEMRKDKSKDTKINFLWTRHVAENFE